MKEQENNKQTMRERFDGKFRNSATSTYRNNKLYAFMEKEIQIALIEKEIQLALKEQREEIVEMIEGVRFGYEPPYEGQTDELMENQWEDNVILLNKLLTNLNQEKL